MHLLRYTWLNVKFVGTDISTSKVKWESSNPQKITIDKHGVYFFHEYPSGQGSVTFTTKLGNETFSFVVELLEEVGSYNISEPSVVLLLRGNGEY